MKHMKMLGLLVVAAVAAMAFAGRATAAPVLTSPAGTEYTGEIHVTMKPGTSTVFQAGIDDTCTQTTVKGTVTTNDTTHAAGAASVITSGSGSTPCTKHTVTLATGSLTINDKGEVFTISNEFTVSDTGLGVSCVYGGGASPGTKLGTLATGSPATLDVNTMELPKISGSFFCASRASWTGSYIVTTPTSLFIT
ncbi:MAG: hypothetical protein ACTHNY_01390 [Solirubrobacterales bacterium]